MAFGPIMQLKVGDLNIELAPVTKESLSQFVSPGFQQESVISYLGIDRAPTLEDEVDWYDKTRADKSSLIWGIWHIDDNERKLIGNTGLTNITKSHTIQAVSGSVIINKAYWGKGIASAIHKARTWYAFQYRGLTRVKSAVIHGNIASRKAIEKSGYTLVYVERNAAFINGEMRHQDNMECLNPSDAAWNLWWGSEKPTITSLAARQKTHEAMEWVRENVVLL